MKNRKLLLIVSLVLALTMSLGGTLAYLTDTDEAVNVMTLGNVQIEQHELQRGVDDEGKKIAANATAKEGDLVPFVQGQQLYPAYPVKDAELPYTAAQEKEDGFKWGPYVYSGTAWNGLWDDSKLVGVMDKFVFVENTGKSDAYIRTLIAYECPEGITIGDAGTGDTIGLNVNATCWTEKEIGKITIKGVQYLVCEYTYEQVNNGILAAGNTAHPSLLQVVMNHKAGNEEMELLGNTYEILVLSQACQTINMPETADAALDVAFGDVTVANAQQWFADVYSNGGLPSTVATTAEDLRSALDTYGNIVVTGTLDATDTVDVPTWTNAPAEYVIDATVVKSLSGGTYNLNEASRYGIVARITADETLSLSDMNVTANSQWPMYLSNYGGTLTVSNVTVEATKGAGVYPYGTNGTTTLKNVNVNQKHLDTAYESTTPWAATAVATSNGHNLIIESGTYVGSTWSVYIYNSGANVTINGGTFKAPTVLRADGCWNSNASAIKSTITVNGGSFDGAVQLDWGDKPAAIYINGGSFSNFSVTAVCNGTLSITGGTFDAGPSAYVAEGYTATENTDGTWTVVAE